MVEVAQICPTCWLLRFCLTCCPIIKKALLALSFRPKLLSYFSTDSSLCSRPVVCLILLYLHEQGFHGAGVPI